MMENRGSKNRADGPAEGELTRAGIAVPDFQGVLVFTPLDFLRWIFWVSLFPRPPFFRYFPVGLLGG